ncbi:hypothetical protein BTHE68_36630 [Burkholderia sp. THE68]|uniref:hypothetical protein n=1 Tax=Burkholderiaceae TaxID=119060 RepID=UPI00131690C9|nr:MULTISPECIES: hypothetical protein [Burkholderiaceae]BBU29929.1 hypothetical protein BTHE68_36630 [Burkholderia sp. THE68]BCQ25771.1 hypothetical protein NK8_39490 [Caballeronia sp. NK8]
MSRTDGIAQSRWLADAREEIAAALRTSDEAWLHDMSMRWGCRLAMLVADFGVRVMLHEEGIVIKIEPPNDIVGGLIDCDDGTPDSLARAAWIKLSKLEEHATAVLEASALVQGDAQCDACRETILAWRRMLIAANEWPREEADPFISHACRPILKALLNLASCATGGNPFELAREGHYEDAWREFENFCEDEHARPVTEWGRKYRHRQGGEFARRQLSRAYEAGAGIRLA